MKRRAVSAQRMACALIVLVAITGQCLAITPVKRSEGHMLVAKMRLSDLEGSATEYAYNQQHGHQPVSYVQYTSHGDDARGSVSYPAYANYAYEDYGVAGQPLAPYYPEVQPGYLQPPPPGPALPYYVDYQQQPRAPIYHKPPVYHTNHHPSPVGPAHHGHGEDESYEESSGSDHKAEDNSAHGERGEKGYSGHHDFEHADNKNRVADHHEGEYANEAGHKSGHEESGSHHDVHDHGVAQHEGSSHSSGSFHKKGQKTTGYHNVYHKDEYKKDTDFYDEEHNGGQFEKHGSHKAHHKDEVANHQHGAKHDSGYQQGHHANKGHHDQGKHHSARKGHDAAQGGDSYHHEHSDYASKAARQFANQQGHKSGHGYR